MSDPVRVGVVGLGYWGPNLVRNLARARRAPRSSRSAICDAERLELVGRRYPAVRRTTDVDDVLADDDIDAVAIATPVSTHLPARDGGARGRQARLRREAARRVDARGRRAHRSSPTVAAWS